MMFIDDLLLPWWTAVELSSSLIQGGILGMRINSLAVCRAQQWALRSCTAAPCLALLLTYGREKLQKPRFRDFPSLFSAATANTS
jgi:hypothetical protein